MKTRHFALLYLPTIGLWSLVRAVQFYRRDDGYHGHRGVLPRLLEWLLRL